MKHIHLYSNLIRIIMLAILILPTAFCYAATSSELHTKQTRQGNTLITEYYDAHGNLVLSDDLKYARLKQQLDSNGRVIKEMYYDAAGKPAELYAGHSGLEREYNKHGNNSKVTFLDADGKPFMNTSGYCFLERTFYTDNTTKTEMYFDINGAPVALSSGIYGYAYKDYNDQGRAEELVCLNREGKPCLNNQGYGITRRTFNSDGSLVREMYYDLDGKQVKLARGQYGVSYKNGEIDAYLDANGNEMFILSLYLIEHLWVVVLCTVLLLALSTVLPAQANFALLLLYIGFILYMTLVNREMVINNLETELFWSYRQWFENPGLRNEIIENMLLFLPFGFIAGRLVSERTAKSAGKSIIVAGIAAVLLSTGIELTQYFTSLGLCELDDVISNSIGGFAGAWLAVIISKFLADKSFY